MLRLACDDEKSFGNEGPCSVESRKKVAMANSATCHPIPERAPASSPANDAAANDSSHNLWLAHSSELALSLLQVARNERPSAEARLKILKACGLR
jgi:hypothetical protein